MLAGFRPRWVTPSSCAVDVAHPARAELVEDNNNWGTHYCWSPVSLVLATPVARPSPPAPTAGWEFVPAGTNLFYNCDGLRLPGSASPTWRWVAVMPDHAGDVYLRLHFPLVGTRYGFDSVGGESSWGPGESDFVLVDGHLSDAFDEITAPLDAGVVLSGEASAFVTEAVTATSLPVESGSQFGPYTLDAGHLLDLYQVELTPETWRIDLTNVSGSVDWGLSLYGPGGRFHGKSDAVDGAIAWLEGPALGEHVTIEVADPGPYALAVWKTDESVTAEGGSYSLEFTAGVSAVPNPVGTAGHFGLSSVFPNPFNPQTEIAYSLASRSAVTVAIYDLRGRCVRKLVMGIQPAGRYSVLWNGRSDAGDIAPSGVYMVRLQAGNETWTRKVSLLK